MSEPRPAAEPEEEGRGAPSTGPPIILPMPPERYNTLYGPGLLTQVIMDLTACYGRIADNMSPQEMREVVELARCAERLRLLRGGSS